VRVIFCGVRGSTPAPGAEFARYGGHTSCIALAHGDHTTPTLILDAGTGIRGASTLLDGRAFSGTILLTHLHWDHVQGLPFFAAGDRDDARVGLLLPAQENGASAESVLARAMSPPHFPKAPSGLVGSWSFGSVEPGELSAEGFTVLAREIPHRGGRTFGYRVSDGRSTLAYMPDHSPTAFGPGPDGCGEYHAAALELAAGVDLLVHDAQLMDEELSAEQRFGHATAKYAGELAARAGAHSAVLFHHAPGRTDEMLDRLAESVRAEPPVSVAVQGAALEL
jgi:phosphoribosyl 1,2-cyclic phosphodiesterase